MNDTYDDDAYNGDDNYNNSGDNEGNDDDHITR